ncbi:MAG: ribonuclease E/G [Pseudorhodobacter sp.]
MKGRLILIDKVRQRPAAALLEDGQLQDLLIDPPDNLPLKGAVYRAVADRPVKGMGGIFVKIPDGKGFLRQNAGIATGRPILVQVTGTAEPGKAIPVTTRLLFKSRYAIVTPGAAGLNISRRIKDTDLRIGLERLASDGMAGCASDLGLILRSACEAGDDHDIAADIAAMRSLAETICADLDGAPELLLEGASAPDIAWRDWADPPPDTVEERPGCFTDHAVDDMIEALLSPRIDLGSGAHIMMEPTRALVAVDVNTGPDTSPAASLKTNIAAARELPRQLRLRGLGGQVVMDFAPMPKRNRHILDQTLKAAFRRDSAETSLVGWTTLGLYELIRKRDRIPLRELLV